MIIFHRLISSARTTRVETRAQPFRSALPASRATVSSPRFLPFTCGDIGHIVRRRSGCDRRLARGLRDKSVMTERLPAFLREMRHHRRETLDEHVAGFREGEAQIVGDIGAVSIAPTAAPSLLARS